jgi:hypothetical protein
VNGTEIERLSLTNDLHSFEVRRFMRSEPHRQLKLSRARAL